MEARRLGSMSVSCIGLGGMPMSIAGRPDEAQSVKVIHAAIAAGMTFIDTADVYCLDDSDIGHNERLIARALSELGAAGRDVVVATKGGLQRPGGSWVTNAHPDRLKKACEASLKALGVERIDLYQLHAPDGNIPLSDSMGALADLQSAGKIRHIGVSNFDVGQIEEARQVVEVVSVQNRCNPMDVNSFANGVVKYCDDNNIAFLPHSPVGGHGSHGRVSEDSVLLEVGQRHQASPYEVCLAFLLSVSPVMLPIPGASRIESAQSSAKAGDLMLDENDLAALCRHFPSVGI